MKRLDAHEWKEEAEVMTLARRTGNTLPDHGDLYFDSGDLYEVRETLRFDARYGVHGSDAHQKYSGGFRAADDFPARGYFRCPVCDAEWPDEDEDSLENKEHTGSSRDVDTPHFHPKKLGNTPSAADRRALNAGTWSMK